MIGYANPKRFLDASRSLPPWLFAAAAIFIGFGLYLSLFVVPVSGLPAGLSAAEADGVARPRREAAAVEVGDALAVGAGEAEAAGLVAGVAVIEGEPAIAGEAAAVAPGEA